MARAIGEDADRPVGPLLDPDQRRAAMVERVRQCLPQRAPDARPGAGHGKDGELVDDAAVQRKPGASEHVDPKGRAE
jgi:hypothetical protein